MKSAWLIRSRPWYKLSWALQALLKLSPAHLSRLSSIHRARRALPCCWGMRISDPVPRPFALIHRPTLPNILRVKLEMYPEASPDFPSSSTSVGINFSLLYIYNPSWTPSLPFSTAAHSSVVNCVHPPSHQDSLIAQLVKNPLAVWETWVWSLGWEDPLEKGKATHSSILAWRIPWTV